MRCRLFISGIILVLFTFSCDDTWHTYYAYPETVERKLWDEIQSRPELSSFVEIIKEYKLDTLFGGKNFYTFFIPDNEAILNFKQADEFSEEIVKYHIINQFINLEIVQGKRKVETIAGKFALLENTLNQSYDESEIKYISPLYLDGKFYTLKNVVKPKQNLFEYISVNSPILMKYIVDKDSIVIDKELSQPIDFDEFGNTIYDTVGFIYNSFEELYFPVRKEYRNKTATLIFPAEEIYNSALDLMAAELGGNFTNHNDIPELWQLEVLTPYLLKQGMFSNMLEAQEFVPLPQRDSVRMRNILGDSVDIYYRPVEKVILSNGYAYNYNTFVIPDSLYIGKSRFEGERLVTLTGVNKYDWLKFAKVNSSIALTPTRDYVASASNDSIIQVNFPTKYSQVFTIEFYLDYLFPKEYRAIVGTHMDIGGIYKIYVNDELVKTFDYYDYVRYRGVLPSVTGLLKDRFSPTGRFNKFDFWVNITEYQKPKIKFEYTAPGNAPKNGFVLDMIEFIPK